MKIQLAEAISQLRDDLRQAVLEGGQAQREEGQKILFTPRGIELELAFTFGTEAKAGGGFKLLAFLDLSTEAKASKSNEHKIKLILDVADENGNPLKVSSNKHPSMVR